MAGLILFGKIVLGFIAVIIILCICAPTPEEYYITDDEDRQYLN